jgi:hypothetical protein
VISTNSPYKKIEFVIVMPSIHNTPVVALAAAHHHILTVPRRRKSCWIFTNPEPDLAAALSHQMSPNTYYPYP